MYTHTHIYHPTTRRYVLLKGTGIRMSPNFSTETREAKRQNSEGKF